jgi:hypothetical protein
LGCGGGGESNDPATSNATAGTGDPGLGGEGNLVDPNVAGSGGGGGTVTIDPNAPDPNQAVDGERTALCAGSQADAPGYRMARRLSQGEYNRTLRDVFGIAEADWQQITFPGEIARRGAYENYSDALQMNEATLAVIAEKSFERAEMLLDAAHIGTTLVTPCVAGAIDAACADAMVLHYGYRLYRRPLTDTEKAGYSELFARGGTLGLTGEQALAGVLGALMHAPGTLYIEQLGQTAANGVTYDLGPYEVASVLAYGLTGSTPSPDLLDRAGSGALSTQAGIAIEVQTLIASPAGQAHLRQFLSQWLGFTGVQYAAKDPTVYDVPTTTTQAMVEEARLLIEARLNAGEGLTSLLTAPSTFMNKSLAEHYGADATGLTEEQFVERARPAGQGQGYLTTGAFLAKNATSNSSSPTQRGVFVLGNLMCRELGQPPPVVPEIVPPSTEVTTRERYEDVHGVDECSPCHGRMDPIGFAFENFDGIGRYRTEEVGKPIDATGVALDLGERPSTACRN